MTFTLTLCNRTKKIYVFLSLQKKFAHNHFYEHCSILRTKNTFYDYVYITHKLDITPALFYK